MTTTSETGHVKNVANLGELVSFVTGYGNTYNPSKPAIKLAALQTLYTAANGAIKDVNDVNNTYSLAVDAREQVFLSISKFSTAVLNALKATDATVQEIEDANSIIRKIQGTRATPKKTEEEKQALLAQGKQVKEISASQMSYDNRLNNLDKLHKLLANIPVYTPNETELTVQAIKATFTDLSLKNKAVIDTTVKLSNTRISRNNILYNPTTGMLSVVTAVKKYIKSVYGATSPQYKQLSKLVFTKPKTK